MQTQLSRPHTWAIALTATLTLSVSYVDRQTFAVLAPTIQAAFHISEVDYGDFLVPAFSVAYLVGAPIAGAFIDRIGARRGLLGAVLVWSLVAAMHALAPGFGALFALRIALGFAESPSFPGAAQTVHRALAPSDQARGFGLLFTGSSIGAMIAPPLATYLEHRWGFQIAFLGTALVGLSWIPLWLFMTYRSPAREVLDRVEPSAEPPPLPHLDARAGKSRLSDVLTVAGQPEVIRATLVVFASAPLLNLYFNWGSKYLVHDHGLKQFEVGSYLAFPPLLFDLGSLLFGHLASRARTRGSLGVPRVLVLYAALVMMVGLFAPWTKGPLAAVMLISVSMAGGGGLYALTTSDLMARIKPQWVSTAGGLCATAQSLSYIAASPLIGRTIAATHRYTEILLMLTAWVVPGCVAWFLWKLPEKRAAV